jgi:hypothetical protein
VGFEGFLMMICYGFDLRALSSILIGSEKLREGIGTMIIIMLAVVLVIVSGNHKKDMKGKNREGKKKRKEETQ